MSNLCTFSECIRCNKFCHYCHEEEITEYELEFGEYILNCYCQYCDHCQICGCCGPCNKPECESEHI